MTQGPNLGAEVAGPGALGTEEATVCELSGRVSGPHRGRGGEHLPVVLAVDLALVDDEISHGLERLAHERALILHPFEVVSDVLQLPFLADPRRARAIKGVDLALLRGRLDGIAVLDAGPISRRCGGGAGRDQTHNQTHKGLIVCLAGVNIDLNRRLFGVG